jgi:hypothetical protein
VLSNDEQHLSMSPSRRRSAAGSDGQDSWTSTPMSPVEYRYEEVLSGTAPQLDQDHLERYLDEESLLEHLAICKDFLVFLSPQEIEEKKYRAMLTSNQYCG